MIIHSWKFEKKMDCSKRPSEKKNCLEQKQKEKKWRKKKSRSAIWALLCKVSGIDDIWKGKKLCSTSL